MSFRKKPNRVFVSSNERKEAKTHGKPAEKAQKGDSGAFGELLSAHEAQMYRVAYLQVKNRVDALEVMQEASFRAFRGIGTLKKPEYFKTWLMRIVMNCAVDFIRRNARLVPMDEQDMEQMIPCSDACEEEWVQHVALDDLMHVLTAEEKNVLLLKYGEEYSFSQIAQLLDMPLGTVKTLLYRALNKLRIKAKEDKLYEGNS